MKRIRHVPGKNLFMGVSIATNTVTVNGQTAYRKGEYFRKELPIANTSSPAWTNITVAATGQSSVSGYTLVPKTPEQLWYDTDGNLAKFHTGNLRIKLTENRTKAMVSDFVAYVQAYAKPCGECRKAFLGSN